MRFFFYGTLCDADVRQCVIGPAGGRHSVEPSTLVGHACVFMRGRPYPTLHEDPNAVTGGLLAHGLDAAAAARVDRFETEEYRRRQAQVVTASGREVTAFVYFAARPWLASTTPWRLEDWQRRHKRQLMRAWFGQD